MPIYIHLEGEIEKDVELYKMVIIGLIEWLTQRSDSLNIRYDHIS